MIDEQGHSDKVRVKNITAQVRSSKHQWQAQKIAHPQLRQAPEAQDWPWRGSGPMGSWEGWMEMPGEAAQGH